MSYSSLLGGAERFLLDLAAGLDPTPALACPEGPLADQASAAGLHVIALPRRSLDLRATARDRLVAPARIAAHARELRSLVEALEPDVVVASGMRTQLAAAALGAGRPPLVFQHHDLLPGPLVARAVRAAARRADVVVAASDCIARDLDPSGTLRTHVINPGVELSRFELSPPPAGPPEVLVLGAVVPWKRPDVALDVIALAARELPDLRVRVAGEPIGADGERLLAMLRRRADQPDLHERVEFPGRVEAADALRRATCLLHCAEREPFGIVLAEALAAARPVVAPASCGPAEIVDESCGRLYPPGDAEAAARLLVEAIRNAQTLGAGGRARAERLYEVDRARKKFRQLLGDLLPDPDTRHPTRPAQASHWSRSRTTPNRTWDGFCRPRRCTFRRPT